ncbi:hypothetical protein PHSY_003633 [Pseudozyma hubeiensis SY62]|uniref:Uncharacterized protein n=1 Tax=Pseudozyma hubeiensis (strain SY62) TaxID=1305764 RepID=R9P426_PSEHS|nr:hypothetical protein PHSY_003633 [Pseudozyma hubeiensis SY62]GAC96054.1 hypothetical protein PHSY_003633 [Pseudozyma hubeiensis SY62]
MSTAHRPTFAAAKGRESKFHNSQRRSHFSLPQHTKLKFRQPAQSASASSSSSIAPDSSSNVSVAPSIAGPSVTKRRDLKRELEVAEWEAKNKRRAKQGLEPLPLPASRADEGVEEDDEDGKRRREAIAKAIELDRDSNDDDDDDESVSSDNPSEAKPPNDDASASSSSESDSESGSDSGSEDEQTQLLLELEKIKAERLAEKTRLAHLNAATETLSRQDEIARGNPLLNLQNAFQRDTPQPLATEDSPNFAVSKRWDHDVIFKNQASAAGNTGRQDGKGGFVNDLTRSEFHRKFMHRYIK